MIRIIGSPAGSPYVWWHSSTPVETGANSSPDTGTEPVWVGEPPADGGGVSGVAAVEPAMRASQPHRPRTDTRRSRPGKIQGRRRNVVPRGYVRGRRVPAAGGLRCP